MRLLYLCYSFLLVACLSSCNPDERIVARIFIPILVFAILGIISKPLLKRSKEKNKNLLNDEIKNMASLPKNENSNLESAFNFNVFSKNGLFIFAIIFLFFGLILSFYAIFIFQIYWLFIVCLTCLVSCLIFRSYLVIEVKATIKIFENHIELITADNTETLVFYPQELSYLRLYEVYRRNNYGIEQIAGKMIELKFNEEHLQNNDLAKLDNFKKLYCNDRPSINQARDPILGLLSLFQEDISLLWNEYKPFSISNGIKSKDGKDFRKEILKFCVNNSIEIRNDLNSHYSIKV